MAEAERVEFEDLLVSIKSTRNVNEIKEKLDREQLGEQIREERRKKHEKKSRKKKKMTEEEVELEAAYEEQRKKKFKKVLDAPLHRQARTRIEAQLAYRQTKEELRQWDPIVDGLRSAEQLQFPHEERRDDPLRTQTAEERAKTFTPRTELELRMAEVLNKSKYVIRPGEEYSQAEKELLKAMDVKEARRKCAELRKMRTLMSFHAAKMKRQSKIKSKQFHRIRKRQQRREMIKEVEQLLVRAPEEADEKLKELEKDRAYERATLKHRGTNKWTKQVRKFASRNPELRKRVEGQLRLGRELKGRHGVEGAEMEEEEEEEDEKMNVEEEEKGEGEGKGIEAQLAKNNPFYRSALQNIKRERKMVAKEARTRAKEKEGNEGIERAEEKKKEDGGMERTQEKKKKDGGMERTEEKNKKDGGGMKRKEEKKSVEQEENEEELFLDLNVRPPLKIPTELTGDADSDTDVQQQFWSEAYGDDDVLGDFRKRKEKVEEEEKPKAKASKFLRGWGAWTGPGISEQTEQERELRAFGKQPEAKAKRRKDAQRPGVIIREEVAEGVQRLQPRDVPFPFTRIQDYEAYIRQPLGRDWNTPISHQHLIKPAVVTKNGRIIRPLDKDVKKRRQKAVELMGDDDIGL